MPFVSKKILNESVVSLSESTNPVCVCAYVTLLTGQESESYTHTHELREFIKLD